MLGIGGAHCHWIQLVLRITVALLLSVCVCQCLDSDDEYHHNIEPIGTIPALHASQIRVAIIGAGIGGSSAAYFLKNSEIGEKTEVTLFERNHQVGGRISDIIIRGKRMETGASIFHLKNKFLCDFVSHFRLATTNKRMIGEEDEEKKEAKEEIQEQWGIWDGEKFKFVSSSWGGDLVTIGKLIFNYGSSPFTLESLLHRTLEQFLSVYTLLHSQKQAFPTIELLLSRLNLLNLTHISLSQYLAHHGISDEYIKDYVAGVTRINYGQSPEIHALVGLVALIGASRDIDSVRIGNKEICNKLIEESLIQLRTNTTVKFITRNQVDNTYTVGYELPTNQTIEQVFHAVIIAAPLEFANITLNIYNDNTVPPTTLDPREYQTTHVTLVVGRLRSDYFNFKTGENVPQRILTTEDPRLPFNSLFAWKTFPDGARLYKIFSRGVITDQLLSQFIEIDPTETVWRTVWKAYPVLRPTVEFPPLVIRPNLFYVNAMETAFSTMETEVISSRNIVNLLVQSMMDSNHFHPPD